MYHWADRIPGLVVPFERGARYAEVSGPATRIPSVRRPPRSSLRLSVRLPYSGPLLDSLPPFASSPVLPSSGDNRDYCDYTHVYHPSEAEGSWELTVREVTVKSFSLAHQIRRPGFQLLSLVSPPLTPSPKPPQTFADQPCLLPDQYNIYNSVYPTIFVLTVLILLISNLYRARQRRQSSPTPISLSPVEGRQNGGLTVPQPETAVWTPYTPWSAQTIPRSTSPRNTIPPSLRIPNGLAAPTLRAFSRPSSPHGSPLLSPMVFPHEDDEDDSLYPAQYAVRREALVPPISVIKHSAPAEESQGAAEHAKKSTSQFLPAPGSRNLDRQPHMWSRTFIIRGQRLRIIVPFPGSVVEWLRMLVSAGSGFGEIRGGRRRSVLAGTAIDGLAALWPAVIVWIAIAMWMF